MTEHFVVHIGKLRGYKEVVLMPLAIPRLLNPYVLLFLGIFILLFLFLSKLVTSYIIGTAEMKSRFHSSLYLFRHKFTLNRRVGWFSLLYVNDVCCALQISERTISRIPQLTHENNRHEQDV